MPLGVKLQAMFDSANRFTAAGWRTGSAPPPYGFPQKFLWDDCRELPDQPLGVVSETLTRHEKMDPWAPIVILGGFVIQTKQFRSIAEQRRRIPKVGCDVAQPWPNDIEVESAREFDALHECRSIADPMALT
jgi:hypothetical protein